MHSGRPPVFNNDLRDRDPDGLARVIGETILPLIEPIHHSVGYRKAIGW